MPLMVELAEFDFPLLFCAAVSEIMLSKKTTKRIFFMLEEVRIEVN
jgi:hypothetical protein